MTFVRGALDEVKPGRLETRASVTAEMKAHGDTVIEDDSPVAQAHWALAERRK